MTTAPQMLDELRLRMVGKHPAEDLRMKAERLALLEQIGSYMRAIVPHETQVNQIIGWTP